MLPAHLVDDVVSAKMLDDRQTGVLEQLTLAALIETGDFDRHIRRSRLIYRRRREHLLTAVRRAAPACRFTGVAAGLHVMLDLPDGASEDDLVERAARRGLALDGLGEFAAGSHGSAGGPGEFAASPSQRTPALVIGYGTPPGHAFTAAVARLTATLSVLA